MGKKIFSCILMCLAAVAFAIGFVCIFSGYFALGWTVVTITAVVSMVCSLSDEH